jgi:hypothetical protein
VVAILIDSGARALHSGLLTSGALYIVWYSERTGRFKNCLSFRPQLKGRGVIQLLILVLSDGLRAVPKLRCFLTVFPPQWLWFDPGSCGICCGQVAVWQVFSEYFSSPYQFALIILSLTLYSLVNDSIIK